ncbi:ribosomal-protein-alanine N-acetyltransferase [Roseovarius azorensis]|uniref:Ribosomal-protein-alanine N-acetyltransferase n=1 Tax=Roseovarius azorensis TaxID=1287727 RepID=A0A1H7IYQ4_9RHOB|nr:GNAT family N-acetyltransferase [Roseovarius azorensis]SEK66767.1 ribosomal-protein-alanine N-acetyltransferase [Roseovarius azorensis]
MTPEDMARTHARAFEGQARAWSTAEFKSLLDSPLSFATGDRRAFALGRAIADEAELLTLATDPAHRRRGLARACLAAFETEARQRGARSAFLEVAADNAPALALYHAAGYAQTARRAAYYTRTCGSATDALILHKPLT